MCLLESSHYKCGHTYQSKVRTCNQYHEKKAEPVPTLRRLFTRKRADCGDLTQVNHDVATVCSVTCAKRLIDMQNRRKKELVRREEEIRGRARASTREYEQNKKKEEEALRRQRVERARAERGQNQPRMPFASSTNGPGASVSRSNGRHLRPNDTGTLDDPRVRIQASWQKPQARFQAQVPPSQAIAAKKKPAVVSPPRGIPQPSRARILAGSSTGGSSTRQQQPRSGGQTQQTSQQQRSRFQSAQGPPAPPDLNNKPLPAVPPNGAWRPRHPDLAPAPLTLSPNPREKTKAARPPPAPQPPGVRAKPAGYKRDPTMTVPPRKPVGAGASRAPPPAAAAPPPQAGSSIPRYRPNPVFANRQGNTKQQDKKKGWFKRLVSGSDSDEWVSEDAARVERG
ncbi:hypothetical protein C8A01DRAFT_38353 [Parachaetomium inaequale]|uniref:Uncharacterized protein n=1 Tax=Parachaetomium inaequale TaxID=2588326 RepID=A0AAN6PBR1_9PEZI|nr:hypothetical protein C8A01DRAFT_38353 [Parachaetomium inaequale]